jgi:hypothetical protein
MDEFKEELNADRDRVAIFGSARPTSPAILMGTFPVKGNIGIATLHVN